MNSSLDPVRLSVPPSSVRVRPEPSGQALDAVIAEILESERTLAFEAGRAQANAELAGLVDQLTSELDEDAAHNLNELAEASTRIGIQVARELLKLEVVAAGHDIEAMVRSALGQLRSGRDACQVRLHPEDLARLEGVAFGSTVSFEAEPSIRRGDVVVISPQGRLVRSLDDAMDAIGDALRAELQP